MTSVDGSTLLPKMRCFPDGFDGLGNLHIKNWLELHFGEFVCVQTILAVAKDKPCILLMELEHQLRDCREIQIVEMIADVLFFLSSANSMSSSVQFGHFNSSSFHAHLSI